MLVSIHKHADNFSRLLSQLSYENSKWTLASKWIELAASIKNVEIITASFDNTLHYCETSLYYENERSKTLQKFVYEISIFNFIWNGLEVISKIINPPKVPNCFKNRRNVIDDIIFFLKNNFPYIPELPEYTNLFTELENIIKKDPTYANINFNTLYNQKICDNSGKSLALIKLIRNDFAHGSVSLPQPEDWNNNSLSENESINKIYLSSRLLLCTQQMILIAYFHSRPFYIYKDLSHSENTIDIIQSLFSLHTTKPNLVSNFGLFYKLNHI